jgi:cell division septum initiation protein DivIVA
MDVQEKLAQIIQVVEDARAMPMSASCLVNREELLGDLDELRSLLPEQLQQADVLLSDRDAVVEGGRDAAQRLLDQARAEHDRLVEDQAVVVGARERAAIVLSEANAESTRLLSDADDYVDRKLAEFEIALNKLTQQVVRGRARQGARRAADFGRLSHDDPDQLDGRPDEEARGPDQDDVAVRHGSHERLPEQTPDEGPGAAGDAVPADPPHGSAPQDEESSTPGPQEKPDESDG